MSCKLKVQSKNKEQRTKNQEPSGLSYIFCRFHNKVIPVLDRSPAQVLDRSPAQASAGIQKGREKAGSRIKACPVLRYGFRDDRFAIKVLIVTDI